MAEVVTAQLRGDEEQVHASLSRHPTPFKKVLLSRGASLGFPSGTPKRKSLRKSGADQTRLSEDSPPHAPTASVEAPLLPQTTHDVRDQFSPQVVRRLNRHIRFSISDEVNEPSESEDSARARETADAVAATLTQISVDAFAIELEKGGLSAGEAYHEAVSEYLAHPSAFAPVSEHDGTPRPVRRRESLMMSLEKKGAEAMTAEENEDIVSHLSQEELALIDEYADKIEASGIDKLEAYALALDSFIKGIENCHLRRKNSVSSEDMQEGNQASSLRDLFEASHSAYEGDEENDMLLVEIYAEEIVANAGIDSAIAYGIALDSFAADPDAFRRHVKAIYPAFTSHSLDDEVSVATSLFKELPHDPYSESYGASLRKLFQLPLEYNEDDDAIDVMLVEKYADEIQEIARLSEDVAYGVALDSFIADPTDFRCRHIRLLRAPEERRPVVEDEEEDDLSYGASLQRLFKLPSAYAADHDRDVEYVESYARILQDTAAIDEAIAYGLALDAFNADPVEFRKRVLLMQRRPNEEGTEPLFAEIHVTEPASKEPSLGLGFSSPQRDSSTSLNELLQDTFPEPSEMDLKDCDEHAVASAFEVNSTTAPIVVEPSEHESLIEENIAVHEGADPQDAIPVVEGLRRSVPRVTEPMEISTAENLITETAEEAIIVKSMEGAMGDITEVKSTSITDNEVEAVTTAKIDIPTSVENAAIPEDDSKKTDAAVTRQGTRRVKEVSTMDTNRDGDAKENDSKASKSRKEEIIGDFVNAEDTQKVATRSSKRTEAIKATDPTPTQVLSTRGRRGAKQESSANGAAVLEQPELVDLTIPAKAGAGIEREEAVELRSATQDASKAPTVSRPKRGRAALNFEGPEGLVTEPETGISTRSRRKAVGDNVIANSGTKPSSKRGTTTPAPTTKSPRAKRARKENVVLLCDGCDGEFSLKALGMAAVPEGDWFCAVCEKKRAGSDAHSIASQPMRTRSRK